MLTEQVTKDKHPGPERCRIRASFISAFPVFAGIAVPVRLFFTDPEKGPVISNCIQHAVVIGYIAEPFIYFR